MLKKNIDTEFRRHWIPQIFVYFRIFSMLCNAIHFRPNSDGILWNSGESHSLYSMYVFEYFKCKFVRIKSKISRLAEV